MQQAKTDKRHMIQFNQIGQDGKVQSAHSDLKTIEYNKCKDHPQMSNHMLQEEANQVD